jgi:hypothetical protein
MIGGETQTINGLLKNDKAYQNLRGDKNDV